jgi:hypothetical protein
MLYSQQDTAWCMKALQAAISDCYGPSESFTIFSFTIYYLKHLLFYHLQFTI